jgi:hypothetical protein
VVITIKNGDGDVDEAVNDDWDDEEKSESEPFVSL